jgi:hypothetical protein
MQRGPALMQALKRYLNPESTHSSAVVDSNGFRHFSGDAGDSAAHAEPARALGNWFLQVLGQSSKFMRGLSEAMQKDLAAMSREGPP